MAEWKPDFTASDPFAGVPEGYTGYVPEGHPRESAAPASITSAPISQPEISVPGAEAAQTQEWADAISFSEKIASGNVQLPPETDTVEYWKSVADIQAKLALRQELQTVEQSYISAGAEIPTETQQQIASIKATLAPGVSPFVTIAEDGKVYVDVRTALVAGVKESALRSVVGQQAIDDTKIYLKQEGFNKSEQRAFEKANTLLPDGQYISNAELSEIKKTNPEIYNLLITKGFNAANTYQQPANLETQKASGKEINLLFGQPFQEIDYFNAAATIGVSDRITSTYLTPDQQQAILKAQAEIIKAQAKQAGEIVLSLVPVVGTVVFWKQMSPTWRGVSIATDVLFVASVSRLPRLLKAAVMGTKEIDAINDSIKTSQAIERATIKAVSPRNVLKAYDASTKATKAYAINLIDIKEAQRVLKTTKPGLPDDRTFRPLLRQLQKEAPRLEAEAIRAGDSFAEAQRAAQAKKLGKVGKVAFDDPDFMKDFGSRTTEAIRNTVNAAYEGKIPSLKTLTKQYNSTVKQLAVAVHDGNLAGINRLQAQLAEVKQLTKIAKGGELQQLQSSLVKARGELEILEKGFTKTPTTVREIVRLRKQIVRLEIKAADALRGFDTPRPPPGEVRLPSDKPRIDPDEFKRLKRLEQVSREKYEADLAKGKVAVAEQKASEQRLLTATPIPAVTPQRTPIVVPVKWPGAKPKGKEVTERQLYETPDQVRERIKREQTGIQLEPAIGKPLSKLSPYTKTVVSPSRLPEPARQPSPAKEPSPIPQPQPETAPKPKTVPSTVLEPAPSPGIEPTPTKVPQPSSVPSPAPQPQPQPKAPPSPTPPRTPPELRTRIPRRFLPLPSIGKGETREWTPEEIRSAVGWKQGFVVIAMKAPYNSQDDVRSYSIDKVPSDLRIIPLAKGKGSASGSYIPITGKAPAKETQLDIGVTDALFSRKGLRFRADPLQLTRGDVNISRGIKNRKVRRGYPATKKGRIYYTKIGGRTVLSRKRLGVR